MEEATTLWIFDFNVMIFYVLTSWIVYFACALVPEIREKLKTPVLPGLAVSILSFFSVGLYAVFVIGFYFLGVWVISRWKDTKEEKAVGSGTTIRKENLR